MDAIWQSLLDFITAHLYISPFWYWCFIGAIVITCATAAGWFFSILRPLAGAIVFAVIAALIGYRRGEKDAETKAKGEENTSRS